MIKIGVVNIDVSHPKAFSQILMEENRARYAAVFNEGFRGEDEVNGFRESAGLDKICHSLEELVQCSDVGFIQACNWDKHISHAMPFLRAGKLSQQREGAEISAWDPDLNKVSFDGFAFEKKTQRLQSPSVFEDNEMKICATRSGVEIEPLKTAFGFKGSALTCLWQVAVEITTETESAVGVGVQSVLWSDSSVFQRYGEEKGNSLMYSVTQYALRLLQGNTVADPGQALDLFYPQVYDYAVALTKMPALSKTFVLNALVPVDLALWQLWRKETQSGGFDSIWRLPCEKQIADFLRCLSDDTQPFLNAHEGKKAVQLVEAVYRAAETGEKIIIHHKEEEKHG